MRRSRSTWPRSRRPSIDAVVRGPRPPRGGQGRRREGAGGDGRLQPPLQDAQRPDLHAPGAGQPGHRRAGRARRPGGRRDRRLGRQGSEQAPRLRRQLRLPRHHQPRRHLGQLPLLPGEGRSRATTARTASSSSSPGPRATSPRSTTGAPTRTRAATAGPRSSAARSAPRPSRSCSRWSPARSPRSRPATKVWDDQAARPEARAGEGEPRDRRRGTSRRPTRPNGPSPRRSSCSTPC